MTSEPRYEPYLDGPPGEFRWRLGLRPLDLSDWLQFDHHAPSELAAKADLLTRFPETVFVIDPEADVTEASIEVNAAIAAVVPTDYLISDPALHPLDAAGRMVQEDLVLMVERDGELVCGGGSVCFPNRWHLPNKVGRSMREIHQPVPGLNDQLGEAIDRSLARLTPERAFWRLGWTVIDTDDLYQAVDGTAAPVPSRPASGADYWLRVERETLRRFPQTGAVLFTIRTYLSPVRSIPATSRSRLAAVLDSMNPEILEYKALADAGEIVSNWLRRSDLSTSR